jgi:hypothetical protein
MQPYRGESALLGATALLRATVRLALDSPPPVAYHVESALLGAAPLLRATVRLALDSPPQSPTFSLG